MTCFRGNVLVLASLFILLFIDIGELRFYGEDELGDWKVTRNGNEVGQCVG
ncbi:hypothetical protein C1H46_019660 [Malus baccata]|uniref:Uncharacterized protein n=1 Tax=Malus baccata TaxID=106549 RepID=A0A540M7J1_MALBA|nr:hypothetical protein C1H46_019660 [Malus baccata]